MNEDDGVRYKLLDEDIEARLQEAERLLKKHNKEKNTAKLDTRISYVGEKEDIAEQMRKAKEAHKNHQKEMRNKRKERLRCFAKTILKRTWLLVAIVTVAAIGIYTRYVYETKGTQVAEYNLFICHTPGCNLVKKIDYNKMVYFHGVNTAGNYGYWPCPVCHKISDAVIAPYSPNERLNESLERGF